MFKSQKFSKLKATALSLGTFSIALGSFVAIPQLAEAATVRSGFNSNTLAANDDSFTDLVPIGFEVNLGGLLTNELYVNNNGNVTFDLPLNTFTPFNIETTDRNIIAPFFADIDTRGNDSSLVTYGTGTVGGRDAFGVNWVDVGFYNTQDSPLNSFQLVLVERSDVEAGAFDIEFNYDRILWETGQASGGDANGLGGSSARVGYAYGTGDDRVSFELAGSAVNGALLDGGVNALVNPGNVAENGFIYSFDSGDADSRYLFSSRGGEFVTPVDAIDPVTPVDPVEPVTPNPDTPNPATTPEPASILGLFALGTVGIFKRKRS